MFGLPFPFDAMVRGAGAVLLTLVWVVALVRLVGLRSFSKMTSFDFVTTVATGSLLAGTATARDLDELVRILAAIACLFFVQYGIAWARRASPTVDAVVSNEPLLLMRDGAMIDRALAVGRVTEADVIAKLREANALEFAKVRAVVLETTGDISVLHGDTIDPALLRDVRSVGDD